MENLSGSQTKCAMIGNSRWDASDAVKFAASRGLDTLFIYGSVPRHGNTDRAITRIAQRWVATERGKVSLISVDNLLIDFHSV